MAELPNASILIDDQAGAFAGGTGYAVVLGCVPTNADITPRVFASAKGLLTQHGYSQAADYAALHIEATKKPVIFVGLPIVTAGTLLTTDGSRVTGTSAVSVAAGSDGYLDDTDASVTVTTGGTVGTTGIVFALSMDGGRTSKSVRLGASTSYAVPLLGVVISFGAGTLVAGDVFSFATKAPLWDSAGLSAARLALASQQKLARSWVVVGDLPNSTFAGFVTSAVNTYETSNDRFVYARTSVKDRLPLPTASKRLARMVGAPSLTFAEIGISADTITRPGGSWIADGFAVGDTITVTGTASNNVTGPIVSLSATVITLGTTDLANETTSAGAVSASPTFTFAEVGPSGDTVTRSSGSWLTEGFAVGDIVSFSGTVGNDVTGPIAVLSATVLTFDATDLLDESIASSLVTAVKVQAQAAYVSATDTAFASVDGQRRIDLAIGRARVLSPVTGWLLRRSTSWAASIREYAHDLQIPSWRKSDGPLLGWDMTDGSDQVVEFDERVDGGGLAGRFTCLRTWSNGPNGAYVALSLTRAPEGSLLSRTHNMSVVNLACTVAHAETEHAIGQVLVLNANGTGQESSLQKIEERVNTALQIALLQQGTEGQRASKAVWRASRTDILNVPGATLNGLLDLLLNGTIEQVATVVRIQTAG